MTDSVNKRLARIEERLGEFGKESSSESDTLSGALEELRNEVAVLHDMLAGIERTLDELVWPVGRARQSTADGKLDRLLQLVGDEDA